MLNVALGVHIALGVDSNYPWVLIMPRVLFDKYIAVLVEESRWSPGYRWQWGVIYIWRSSVTGTVSNHLQIIITLFHQNYARVRVYFEGVLTKWEFEGPELIWNTNVSINLEEKGEVNIKVTFWWKTLG